MHTLPITIAFTASLVIAATTLSAAEPRKGHSDYLASLTENSLKKGFPARSVHLLDVVPGPGREVAAKVVLGRLNRGELGKRLKLDNLKPGPADRRVLSFLGESGYVEVMDDGSKLRVRAAIDDPKEIARAGNKRIEKKELEELGRRYVRGSLAPLVKLGKGETLTFLGVRYVYNGEASMEGAAKTPEREHVVANVAIFGREIAGLPVVGSGSKVAVWFTTPANLSALMSTGRNTAFRLKPSKYYLRPSWHAASLRLPCRCRAPRILPFAALNAAM